jgi:putative membrane protein
MAAPSEAATGLSGRLHPAAILVRSVGQLLPLAFVLIAGDTPAFVAGIVLGGTVLVGVVRWWRLTWRLDAAALVVEEGLLQRRRRVIPLDRVQSVDLVRGLRHRLFGVTELRVEVVGGTGSEGRLEALSPARRAMARASSTVAAARS